MCGCRDCPKAGALKVKSQRRKLWEVDERWMCAVIGTCLSVPELRRLAEKAKLRFTAGPPSDYQLHGAMVQLAKQSCLASRLAHKLLERKFAVAAARFSRAGCPGQLRRLWEEAKASGEVPGAYWALVTHPYLGAELGELVFGEIHMMSHLAGAAFRGELRRQSEAERRVFELEAELERTQVGAARAFAERDRRIRVLTEQAAWASAERSRRAQAEAKLAAFDHDAERLALRARLADAERELLRTVTRLEAAEARAAVAEARAEALRTETQDAAAEAAELRATLAGLAPAANDAVPNLVGRCVLYVGGRSRLMPHLQAVMRRCNGELMHHDGGLSDGCARLEGALERADVVVCPIDCVSHDAVDRIKTACRRCDKPFVPLRGMGVSAFLRGLQSVTEVAAAE